MQVNFCDRFFKEFQGTLLFLGVPYGIEFSDTKGKYLQYYGVDKYIPKKSITWGHENYWGTTKIVSISLSGRWDEEVRLIPDSFFFDKSTMELFDEV